MSEKKLKTIQLNRQKIGMLLMLVAVTLLVLLVYRVAMNFPWFKIVLIAYMVLTPALILTYIFYNRGFSRRGVTPEMLPEEWSEEQKEAWIEDGKERMRRSKWMIVPIFALVFTFGVDLIELFFLPFVKELFLK